MTLEQLRALAELLPPGAAVSLPREALLEALAGGSLHTSGLAPAPPGDLTVEEVAARFRRKPSTVRAWLEAGRFPGAYHLPASGKLDRKGRPRRGAWRVPPGALDAFATQERTPRSARRAQLGAWRKRRGLA